MNAVSEVETWLRYAATAGIGGSGVWLIWFLARKLWNTVWEGTKEQNLQLRAEVIELRKQRDDAESLASTWESDYHELYDDYLSHAPLSHRMPRKRRTEVAPGVPIAPASS